MKAVENLNFNIHTIIHLSDTQFEIGFTWKCEYLSSKEGF